MMVWSTVFALALVAGAVHAAPLGTYVAPNGEFYWGTTPPAGSTLRQVEEFKDELSRAAALSAHWLHEKALGR
jgi:hypothetical protein